MNNSDLKSQIRKEFKLKRANLTKEEVEIQSKEVCDNFITTLLPEILKEIPNPIFAIYLDANNEVKTTQIIKYFQENNIEFTLPKISENQVDLNYVKFDKSLNFANNKTYKNIQEPISQNFLTPNILIIPLVAFDKFKNRIGMAKGFFDRSISKLEQQNVQIRTIGLGYEAQLYKQTLPIEKHDQSLDYIVSSHNIYS